MKILFSLFVLFNLMGAATSATEKRSEVVNDYAELLKQVRADKKLSLEKTYLKGMEAINSLSSALSFDESEIDSAWLKAIRGKLEGFDLTPNTETYVANPNLSFFLSLAKKNGHAMDIEFFELMLKTDPDGRWPVYQEQRTDYSGCTVFNGTLSKLHKDWSGFGKKYPHSFIKMTKDRLEDIEKNLSASTCFCTEKSELILGELEKFVKENSKLGVTQKIRKQIEDIKSKKIAVPGCAGIG